MSSEYSTTNDGFQDNNSPQVESYGAGPGSGASDPTDTGLGGYGNQQQGGGTGAGGFSSNSALNASGFDEKPQQSQSNFGGQGTNDGSGYYEKPQRSQSNVGGQGTNDSSFGAFGNQDNLNTQSTAGGFGNTSGSFAGNSNTNVSQDQDQIESYGAGTGASANDPTDTGLGGYSAGNRGGSEPDHHNEAAQRYGTNDFGGQLDAAHAEGQQGREQNNPILASDNNVDNNDEENEQQGSNTGKPSMKDKMRGTAEKLAGTVTGNQGLKEQGQDRKTGNLDNY